MNSRMNPFMHLHIDEPRDKMGKLGVLGTRVVALQLSRMFDKMALFEKAKPMSDRRSLERRMPLST